jgi:FkbM family methyltransferase
VKKNTFSDNFIQKLTHYWYNIETNNIDFIRFPASLSYWEKARRVVKSTLLKFFVKRGFVYFHKETLSKVIKKLEFIFINSNQIEETYNLLENDSSRNLMVDLLLYRVLGSDKVRLPLNNPTYWNNFNVIQHQLLEKSNSFAVKSLSGQLNLYKLDDIGFPLSLHAHPLNIACTFMLEQYCYQNHGESIQAEQGDFVIDAGGCWGDTALYFAHKVGKDGKVFCFEFSESNLTILRQNIVINPCLNNIVEIVPKAIWDKPGEDLFFSEQGSGTSLIFDQGGKSLVSTESIDNFVEEFNIEKIDFIKMDIEGSELNALKGAEKTIKTFKPKLAISVYHQDDDIISIPNYLNRLNIGYKFFFEHFTIHREETVLFAFVEQQIN